MKKYYVYWIKAIHHQDPYSEGYIGCSCQPDVRFRSHTTDNTRAGSTLVKQYVKENGIDNVSMVILAEFNTEKEGKEAEYSYRPKSNIGWNIAKGGLVNPDCTGRKHSPETKKKITQNGLITKNNRKKDNPDIYQSKWKGRTDRWNDNQKKLIGSYHKGKTISEEHKKAITEKNSGALNHNSKIWALKNLETGVITIAYGSKQLCQLFKIGQSALKSAKRDYLLSGVIRTVYRKYQLVPEQGED